MTMRDKPGLAARTQELHDPDLGALAGTLCAMRDVAADNKRPEIAAWLAEAASLVGGEWLRRKQEIKDLEDAAGRTTTWWGDPDDAPDTGTVPADG